MTNLKDLSTGQLQRIVNLKEQIEGLQAEIDSIAAGGGGNGVPSPFTAKVRKKHRMSAAGRAAIGAAAKARWAKLRGEKSAQPTKKRRKFSAAARAKIAAAARARWAKAKAAGKKTL